MKDKKLLITIFYGGGEEVMKIKETVDTTWNSIEYTNVKTVFIKGSNSEKLENNIYYSGTSDDWNMQHIVFKQFLNYVWDWDWDYVLHGSISSYFNKDLCYKKVLTLPESKCYCGKKIDYYDNGYASGAAIFLSRDVCKILREQILSIRIAEDFIIGSVLKENGISITPGADRVENMNNLGHGLTIGESLRDCYHYRCKEDCREDGTYNRLEVINKLNYVHQYITKNYANTIPATSTEV